jgi:hypothetical protein
MDKQGWISPLALAPDGTAFLVGIVLNFARLGRQGRPAK